MFNYLNMLQSKTKYLLNAILVNKNQNYNQFEHLFLHQHASQAGQLVAPKFVVRASISPLQPYFF